MVIFGVGTRPFQKKKATECGQVGRMEVLLVSLGLSSPSLQQPLLKIYGKEPYSQSVDSWLTGAGFIGSALKPKINSENHSKYNLASA